MRTATCHTEGCENAEMPIEIPDAPEDATETIVCGPCGQPIDDVQ